MIEIEHLWNEIDLRTNLLGCEDIALARAVGRVLAREVCSAVDQPPFDQSAVDGYALSSLGPGRFRLAGERAAGEGGGHSLKNGETFRVLTGAVVPEGALAVVKQEDCMIREEGVEIAGVVPGGAHIRVRGDVVKMGERILSSGMVVTPGALGLLAASGVSSVGVVCHPRVLHLITGDEIVATGEALKPGQIHDSNGPMIRALLSARGIPLKQLHLRDSSAQIAAAVAAFDGDVLLISGGSGPGDRDHTLPVLEHAGFKIHASRINSRPGKPLIFASRGNQIAFGLPGNPLSHFVCYHAFVRRALDRLEGFPPPALIPSRLKEPVEQIGDGRRTWIPGVLEMTGAGHEVRPLAWKHSGDLIPIAIANALILMNADNASASSGALVDVLCLP